MWSTCQHKTSMKCQITHKPCSNKENNPVLLIIFSFWVGDGMWLVTDHYMQLSLNEKTKKESGGDCWTCSVDGTRFKQDVKLECQQRQPLVLMMQGLLESLALHFLHQHEHISNRDNRSCLEPDTNPPHIPWVLCVTASLTQFKHYLFSCNYFQLDKQLHEA